MLLTQGWSAYSWEDVFNDMPNQKYNFDVGISFKVIPKKQKNQQFMVAVKDSLSSPEVYALSEKDKGFLVANKFPAKNTPIEISKIKGAGRVLSAEDLRLEFYPKQIPNIFKNQTVLKSKGIKFKTPTQITDFNISTLKDVQQLDEVLVKGKYRQTRIDEIKLKTSGRIDVFDNNLRNQYNYFEDYIIQKGYYYKENPDGTFNLTYRPVESLIPSTTDVKGLNNEQLRKIVPHPTVFIDGVEYRNNEDVIRYYPMTNIDYVSIAPQKRAIANRWGGTIYIVTTFDIPIESKIRKLKNTHSFPLAFEPQKIFYKPKYPTYTSKFFKEYGVIDWLPENNVNENGELQITFPRLEQEEVKLFIEGFTEDGIFTSETKLIPLKD